MTLVLEESEDVSLELLTPILASLKKDNEVANYLMDWLFCICPILMSVTDQHNLFLSGNSNNCPEIGRESI